MHPPLPLLGPIHLPAHLLPTADDLEALSDGLDIEHILASASGDLADALGLDAAGLFVPPAPAPGAKASSRADCAAEAPPAKRSRALGHYQRAASFSSSPSSAAATPFGAGASTSCSFSASASPLTDSSSRSLGSLCGDAPAPDLDLDVDLGLDLLHAVAGAGVAQHSNMAGGDGTRITGSGRSRSDRGGQGSGNGGNGGNSNSGNTNTSSNTSSNSNRNSNPGRGSSASNDTAPRRRSTSASSRGSTASASLVGSVGISYTSALALGILLAPDNRLPLKALYDFTLRHTVRLRLREQPNWRRSVRNTLSKQRGFVRVNAEGELVSSQARRCFWTIVEHELPQPTRAFLATARCPGNDFYNLATTIAQVDGAVWPYPEEAFAGNAPAAPPQATMATARATAAAAAAAAPRPAHSTQPVAAASSVDAPQQAPLPQATVEALLRLLQAPNSGPLPLDLVEDVMQSQQPQPQQQRPRGDGLTYTQEPQLRYDEVVRQQQHHDQRPLQYQHQHQHQQRRMQAALVAQEPTNNHHVAAANWGQDRPFAAAPAHGNQYHTGYTPPQQQQQQAWQQSQAHFQPHREAGRNWDALLDGNDYHGIVDALTRPRNSSA